MSYEKQTWANGDVITANKLNHMEDGIAGAGGGILKINPSDFEMITIDGDSYDSVTVKINGEVQTLEHCYIYDVGDNFGNVPVYRDDYGEYWPLPFGTIEATAVDTGGGAYLTSDTTIAYIINNDAAIFLFSSDDTFAAGTAQ